MSAMLGAIVTLVISIVHFVRLTSPFGAISKFVSDFWFFGTAACSEAEGDNGRCE